MMISNGSYNLLSTSFKFLAVHRTWKCCEKAETKRTCIINAKQDTTKFANKHRAPCNTIASCQHSNRPAMLHVMILYYQHDQLNNNLFSASMPGCHCSQTPWLLKSCAFSTENAGIARRGSNLPVSPPSGQPPSKLQQNFFFSWRLGMPPMKWS